MKRALLLAVAACSSHDTPQSQRQQATPPPATAPLLAPGTPLVAPAVAQQLPPPTDPAVEVVSDGSKTCALLASGGVSCWGGDTAGPHRIPGITDAIGLVIGGDLTCIVHRDGLAGCLVGDAIGPLPGAKHVVQIAANGDAVCVREREGRVACWVEGGAAKLVEVPGVTGATALVMGTEAGPEWQFPLVSFGCALTGGAVTCFELYRQAELDPQDPRQPYDEYLAHKGVPPAQRIVRVHRMKGMSDIHDLLAPHDDDICVRGATGAFRCTNPNNSAPLDPEPDSDSIRAWSGNCIARGTKVTCKHSYSDQSTIDVPGLVKLVDANDHACALITTGRVMCWGSDATNGLGIKRPPQAPTGDVLGLTDAVDLATWTFGAVAVRANGQLVYWGLGNGDKLQATDRPTTFSKVTDAIKIVGLASHACVLRRGDKVSCWGRGGFLAKALEHDEPTEIAGFAGARDIRITDNGAVATLADGHVVHLGDVLLGPSKAETAAPFPGAEHAVDAVVADRWLCTRDRTPGLVTCHAETRDWVAPKLTLDVADVIEMAAVPPHITTSAPRKLAAQEATEFHLEFPSAYVALRRASGEVVQAHLTIIDGVPGVELSPFAPKAAHLGTSELALCAIGDTVICHSDEHDQWAPKIPPELASSRVYAFGNPTCGLRANGHVMCVNNDPVSAGRGLGGSATLVPVDL